MAFKDFADREKGIELLQRSLQRGRLAHGYLFSGQQVEHLEEIARTLAKTLNCQQPIRKDGKAVDCCDRCPPCRKIEEANHPDVHWVRPESKSRVITIDQMREVIQQINLKPNEATYKLAIIVCADRLNTSAANAFLKTLEEPPSNSVLILLTTEPERILETIISRCLRLSFAGDGLAPLAPEEMTWLTGFAEVAAAEQRSLIGRYRLMDGLLKRLTALKSAIEERLTANSPLQRYRDIEKSLQDKWEDELKAAIEAEYRRQRAAVLGVLQWWLRDVWLKTLRLTKGAGAASTDALRPLLRFPELHATDHIAGRVSPEQAAANLQALEELQLWLNSNVQEGLALEVGLLKLNL